MKERINAVLYDSNPRLFMNNELKIIVYKSIRKNRCKYIFNSKKELATFKIIYTEYNSPLSELDLFMVADKIFYEILKIKEGDEIF